MMSSLLENVGHKKDAYTEILISWVYLCVIKYFRIQAKINFIKNFYINHKMNFILLVYSYTKYKKILYIHILNYFSPLQK